MRWRIGGKPPIAKRKRAYRRYAADSPIKMI